MKTMKYNLSVLAVLFVLLNVTAALADSNDRHRGRIHTVTITNITQGQIFSPPVVMVHDRSFKLFELGEPASYEIYSLAEDGLTGPIVSYIEDLGSVFDYQVSQGPVLPGQSVSFEVVTHGRHQLISALGMLVSTNDAFFAVRGIPAGYRKMTTEYAKAYDAGSEANLEACAQIPGPPCGNGGVRNTEGAEGYIYVHSGIHGQGDLDSSSMDWQNPVAVITITPGY